MAFPCAARCANSLPSTPLLSLGARWAPSVSATRHSDATGVGSRHQRHPLMAARSPDWNFVGGLDCLPGAERLPAGCLSQQSKRQSLREGGSRHLDIFPSPTNPPASRGLGPLLPVLGQVETPRRRDTPVPRDIAHSPTTPPSPSIDGTTSVVRAEMATLRVSMKRLRMTKMNKHKLRKLRRRDRK
ncbi:hypothetical protein M427DRAFT_161279 [Gonapodya prolifera JEL478]|uniref:Uncharacterized protein n=1 Tax=Gonapodya prolifera (strain JEL478) TaxID=1344416 RepID=A0A138ZWT9_GONPJ|nr:hypothetical protein M427DRAFT_161279 [Gonapodya prolifera JEL478]|eukprot:KXS08924.1 hypothetical protein M427DRAFT_161279 [Gonapodya prolifera JEL478]